MDKPAKVVKAFYEACSQRSERVAEDDPMLLQEAFAAAVTRTLLSGLSAQERYRLVERRFRRSRSELMPCHGLGGVG